MKLKLESKAKTLEQLSKIITKAKVLPLIRFKANDYLENKDIYLKKILNGFDSNVIVRSSSQNEDCLRSSNAGAFDSVLNVSMKKEELHSAINKVINSYDEVLENDEVFIQPMLNNVSMSGVVFSSDLDTLSPYYIINYDESGSTVSVTSGEKADLKTFVCFKNHINGIDKNLALLIETVKKCEEIFSCKNLDIEFAFDNNSLYILQVRAIVVDNKNMISDVDLDSSLFKLSKKIKKLNAKHPKLLGNRTIFGVMPDWNPAEIIGLKPRALSLSLYKELITDEIWAYQRDNYGYRKLRSFPLLVSFLGVPYIDVRVSFNSFIPKNLHENIASRLVDYYLDELSDNRNNHDKIEFEIVFSCYYFGISKKLKKLKNKGFNDNEIKRIEFELLQLTNNIINVDEGLYKKDLLKIETLKSKYEEIVNSSLPLIEKIYWLIEDCKRYGTLPFAGVARAAFIAVQFLNSFVEENIISDIEKESFLNSLNTVSKQLSLDKECLDKNEFIKIYGHLRPGTYDICSKSYDEAYEDYFGQFNCTIKNEKYEFSKKQKELISNLIIENGLKTNVDELITFIIEAIEGREYAKFVFTKHLSEILNLLVEIGEKIDISREDLSFLDIQKVKNLYATLDHREARDIFINDINKNRDFYEYTKAIKLPNLIINENDIYRYFIEKQSANFVSLNRVVAEVVNIENNSEKYTNKIVCIKSADPGFDYLFSKNIAGLITCFGGANSHMAIRCAELGIPAVIGCGERDFDRFKKSKVIEIDASNKQIKIVS